MSLIERTMAGALILAATIVFGEANGTPKQPQQKSDPQKSQAASIDRGQEVFHQNCSRCHNEPEGFSPNISGTVARHMRVRAGLSNEDYKALLKFFNP